jgi:hypothetical protein
MLHPIDKLFIFFLADGLRHGLSLKALRVLFLLFDTFILNHFFEALIADAVGVVGR